MRSLLFILAYILMNSFLMQAQTNSIDTVRYNKVYDFVEQIPEFPGGTVALNNFVSSHLCCPSDSCKEFTGKVYVKFIVDTAGNVRQPKVLRGLCSSSDSIVIKMMYEMPKWLPGKQNGKPVNVYYTLPVFFGEVKINKQGAAFPGGSKELNKYLKKELEYPKLARKNWIHGTVIIVFKVNEDGSISHITVGKGIGGGCDEEAIRLISEMPAWYPAFENGKKVSSYVSLEIEFEL